MPPLVGCLQQNNGPDGPDRPDKLMVKQMDKLGPLSIDHIEQMKEGLMPIPPGLLPSGPSPGGGEKGSPGGSSGIANYVPNQRLEWKRYKQYTRNDIMAAIEEVKQGMSALQASRKYGVPSRTLYDKVKKMGITTGRTQQKKSMPQYPASFQSLQEMMNLEQYKVNMNTFWDLAIRVKTNVS